MNDESNAVLLHDIRAAMVNHGGLQHEVQASLQQLSTLLQHITSVNAVDAEAGSGRSDALILAEINEIFEEDIDQCLPMLQLSSEKLTMLLNRFVCGDDNVSLSSDS
jgi:hypothetical protein